LSELDRQQRKAFVQKGEFAILPNFSGKQVYTSKYRGTCYELDDGFIVVEPIITLMGGAGYFANKTARVLIAKPDGTEQVLYRAAEHWGALKPPGLTDSEVERRTTAVKLASRAGGEISLSGFGEGDSSMGSGIDYRLFYLRDALVIGTRDYPGTNRFLVGIYRPGSTNFSMIQWASSAQKRATNGVPSRP
jgi:hypothetical protein